MLKNKQNQQSIRINKKKYFIIEILFVNTNLKIKYFTRARIKSKAFVIFFIYINI